MAGLGVACRQLPIASFPGCVVCVRLFLQVLKKYPRLWCMTKPPSRRPKLYIVNLQVTRRSELPPET